MNDVEIEKVHFTQDRLGFELKDDRLISVPLSFYPTLQHASEAQRLNFELYPSSVHWPDVDCDIGVEGMLAGAKELPLYAQRLNANHEAFLKFMEQVPDNEPEEGDRIK